MTSDKREGSEAFIEGAQVNLYFCYRGGKHRDATNDE